MPHEVELNPVTNEEINTMNSVVQIESSLDIKKNEIENRKKYTRKDLVTMESDHFSHQEDRYRGKGAERWDGNKIKIIFN